MTLIWAVAGGLVCGYVAGVRKALIVWAAIWAVVLSVQTLVLVDAGNRDDWSYWPVQGAIVLLAVAMLWLGGRARSWLARRGTPKEAQRQDRAANTRP